MFRWKDISRMFRSFTTFRSLQISSVSSRLQGPQKLIKPAALPADLDGAGQGSIVQDVFLVVFNTLKLETRGFQIKRMSCVGLKNTSGQVDFSKRTVTDATQYMRLARILNDRCHPVTQMSHNPSEITIPNCRL